VPTASDYCTPAPAGTARSTSSKASSTSQRSMPTLHAILQTCDTAGRYPWAASHPGKFRSYLAILYSLSALSQDTLPFHACDAVQSNDVLFVGDDECAHALNAAQLLWHLFYSLDQVCERDGRTHIEVTGGNHDGPCSGKECRHGAAFGSGNTSGAQKDDRPSAIWCCDCPRSTHRYPLIAPASCTTCSKSPSCRTLPLRSCRSQSARATLISATALLRCLPIPSASSPPTFPYPSVHRQNACRPHQARGAQVSHASCCLRAVACAVVVMPCCDLLLV
jgi:hypothetical protein